MGSLQIELAAMSMHMTMCNSESRIVSKPIFDVLGFSSGNVPFKNACEWAGHYHYSLHHYLSHGRRL